MNRYRLSFAQSTAHLPQHADRTAKRDAKVGLDVIYQVFPTRLAMAVAIRQQQRAGTAWAKQWHACVPLAPSEGF